MEMINVPAPPKEAFNKHRKVSDLIRAQVNHLKHVEEKLSPEARLAIPQHPVITENDAALYIASMTRLLRGQPGAVQQPAKKKKKVVEIRPAAGLELAAAAAPEQATKKVGPKAKKSAKDQKGGSSRRGQP